MEAPKKIYVREFEEGINQLWDSSLKENGSHTQTHEYIRKDVVEHIIKSAIGPQDALNKLRSL